LGFGGQTLEERFCVFCGAMKGRVLFFGWMNCRRRPLRTLDTHQKSRQARRMRGDAIRAASYRATFLEKQAP
jgi:hypothetical protein